MGKFRINIKPIHIKPIHIEPIHILNHPTHHAAQPPKISETGFSCNYGNNTVPTIVDAEGVITAPTSYQLQDSQANCINWMNSTNYTSEFTCSNGAATSPSCNQLYKDLKINTFSDLGFASDPNIAKSENIIGKQDGTSYTCASYDGKNCLKNLNLNMQPLKPLENIICESENTSATSPANFCLDAFNYWNLYPSTNPLVIRGRNFKQSILNTITDETTLGNIGTTYQDLIPNTNTPQGISEGISALMENTPIKLGCCSRINPKSEGPIYLSVRTPLSPAVEKANKELASFNFQKQVITIPPNSCPADLIPTSSECNAFFDVYCENVINVFNKQNLPETEFIKYSPECACYAPRTLAQSPYPPGTPTKCYKEGCVSNTVSYLDPTSQGPGAVCDLTVCSNIVNLAGLKAGGNVTISPTLQNNCGSTASSTNTVVPSKSVKPASSNSSTSSTSSTSSISSFFASLFGFGSTNKTASTSETSDKTDSSTDIIIYIVVAVFVLVIIGLIIYYSIKKK